MESIPNYVPFESTGVRVWMAYNVGPGTGFSKVLVTFRVPWFDSPRKKTFCAPIKMYAK